MFGVPYDIALKHHKLLGYASLAIIVVHVVLILASYARRGVLLQMLMLVECDTCTPKEHTIRSQNLAGLFATAAGFILYLTSRGWIRRKYFQVFLYSHIICAVLFLVFACQVSRAGYIEL